MYHSMPKVILKSPTAVLLWIRASSKEEKQQWISVILRYKHVTRWIKESKRKLVSMSRAKRPKKEKRPILIRNIR